MRCIRYVKWPILAINKQIVKNNRTVGTVICSAVDFLRLTVMMIELNKIRDRNTRYTRRKLQGSYLGLKLRNSVFGVTPKFRMIAASFVNPEL